MKKKTTNRRKKQPKFGELRIPANVRITGTWMDGPPNEYYSESFSWDEKRTKK